MITRRKLLQTGTTVAAMPAMAAPASTVDFLSCIRKSGIVRGETLDETLEKVSAHGGAVVNSPYPEGDLWVATLRDPAGNVVGIWQRGPRDQAAAGSG